MQSMQDLEVLGDATGAVHREVLCSPVYTDAQEHIRVVVTSKREKAKVLHLLERMQQIWGNAAECAWTVEERLNLLLCCPHNAVLGFVPVSHMLSKLSEENTSLEISHT